MASPEVLEIASLIEPVQPDRPVGDDPRADASPTSPYYQIKDLRTRARATERQVLMTGDEDGEPPDWRPILTLAPELLQKAKDLEVSAYLTEALSRECGFAGLRDGFRLTRELVERFGDYVFPLPDEDGVETRVAPLSGLNGEGADGTLILPISMIPLTDDSSEGAFGRAAYVQAQELERLAGDARERRISQGAASMAAFQTAVAETSAQFFKDLHEDISQSLEEFQALTRVLDEKYGEFSPPSSNIQKTLESCKETVETVARDKLASLVSLADEVEEEAESETAEDEGSPETKKSKSHAAMGVIENRDDAFREILKISAYFRRTEPHSPISYALEQIVRWGRLPLPELLRELISDESSISQMFRLVGIPGQGDSADQ